MLYLLTGYETTATTLSLLLFELSVNPDIQQRVYQEIQTANEKDAELSYSTLQKLPYLDAVLTECLRK